MEGNYKQTAEIKKKKENKQKRKNSSKCWFLENNSKIDKPLPDLRNERKYK